MSVVEPRHDDELELTDYLKILRRRWPWVVAAPMIVTSLALALSLLSAERFASTAKVTLGNSAAQEAIQGGLFTNNGIATRELSNEVNLALGDGVRAAVVDALGFEPDLAILADDGSDSLEFTATASDAGDAALFANTWARVYVDTKRQDAAQSLDAAVAGFEDDLEQLRKDRQDLRAPLDALEDQLIIAPDEQRPVLQARVDRLSSDLRPELALLDARIEAIAKSITNLELTSRLTSTGTARIVQVAAPPIEPSGASVGRNLTLALVVGLILGAGAALLAENLDRTISTTEDIAALGLPVLGDVPGPGRHLPESELPFATMRHTGTPVAEAYQKVRTAVEFAALGRQIHSLLITSANPAEGKSTLATNLAWAMSAVDHRVALVDVDFRRPRIHEVFNCSAEPGLSDNLLAGTPLNQLAFRVGEHGSQNLIVVPTGTRPPSPGDFVASPAFTALIRRIEAEADLVVLDAPPVLPVSDALSISRHVDAVILVAKAGQTTKDRLASTVENLEQVGAHLIGVCLVGGKETSSTYGSYEHDTGSHSGSLRLGGSRSGDVNSVPKRTRSPTRRPRSRPRAGAHGTVDLRDETTHPTYSL